MLGTYRRLSWVVVDTRFQKNSEFQHLVFCFWTLRMIIPFFSEVEAKYAMAEETQNVECEKGR